VQEHKTYEALANTVVKIHREKKNHKMSMLKSKDYNERAGSIEKDSNRNSRSKKCSHTNCKLGILNIKLQDTVEKEPRKVQMKNMI
jgi:hypothetical protein